MKKLRPLSSNLRKSHGKITIRIKHHRTSNKIFIVHPSIRYKMCIKVDANGSGEGRGSHISVFIDLMKGDYESMMIAWSGPYNDL